MKTITTLIAASSLLAALATAQPTHYTVTDLGAVGGPPGGPYFITNNGLAGGAAALPDGTMHFALWYKGSKVDIGTPGLGGQNSAAFGVNVRGQAVGEAETSDPNGEDFCGFSALGLPTSGTACLPFLWQNGVMHKLPTLGGANGVANMINIQGEVVGWAEKNLRDPDPACPVSQFKPVIWENGVIHELPTWAGDPDGVAASINDKGQVVGSSGTCAPFDPGSGLYLAENHALLWQNDEVTDLGNLGGTEGFAGNHACAINNQGQVVGHANSNITTRAFLWNKETGMQSLDPVPGDFASLAIGINDRGEAVGLSLDANFNLRAVLWENGVPLDLNHLIPANSGLYLQLADSINASGEIVGFAQASNGDVHGFLAKPSNGASASESLAPASQAVTSPMVASENARKVLQQRLRLGRFGAGLTAPR
jgi:probable HAF family extracellular repeat protein